MAGSVGTAPGPVKRRGNGFKSHTMIELSLHRALPVLGFALNLLLVVVTLVADRRDPRHQAFAAFGAALAAWNLGVIGLRSATDPALALRWEWVIHVAIALVPALFVE